MPTYKHHHTNLTSRDPENLANLFVKLMGARITGRPGSPGKEMIDLELGGVPLRISEGTGADGVWKGTRFGLHHLGVAVDDLDSAAKELKAAGIEFVLQPVTSAAGIKASFIQLDNVLIEVIQP